MALFQIEAETCSRCGACVDVCPMRLFRVASPDLPPSPVPGAHRFCIRCGHCVAVCPTTAVLHKSVPLEECRPLEPGWNLGMDQVEPLIKGRRSIRTFSPDPLDRSLIEKALDLARYAPSGTNSQPLSWTVLHQPGAVSDLSRLVMDWVREEKESSSNILGPYADYLLALWQAGQDPICRRAPHLIYAHGAADPGVGMDAVIALTTLSLAALPLGFGTCWAGFVQMGAARSQTVRTALRLPPEDAFHGGLMLGRPQHDYHRIPPRKPLRVNWA